MQDPFRQEFVTHNKLLFSEYLKDCYTSKALVTMTNFKTPNIIVPKLKEFRESTKILLTFNPMVTYISFFFFKFLHTSKQNPILKRPNCLSLQIHFSILLTIWVVWFLVGLECFRVGVYNLRIGFFFFNAFK